MKWTNRRNEAKEPHPGADKLNGTGSETKQCKLWVIWPAFVLWMRKRGMSACLSVIHTTDKQWASHLMESWPATKDVPPREMSEPGLGSRFFTMCSITLSTVLIRPLATTVDCCSTHTTQASFRLRPHCDTRDWDGVTTSVLTCNSSILPNLEQPRYELSGSLLNINEAKLTVWLLENNTDGKLTEQLYRKKTRQY